MTTPAPWTAQPAPADLGHPDGTWLITGPDTDQGEPHTAFLAMPCGDGPHPDERAQADAELVVGLRNGGHPVKVVIDTPGPTITVEAVGQLDTIKAAALDLYRETITDWPKDQAPTRGAGFSVPSNTERSWT